MELAPKVEIYTKAGCIYSENALAYLQERNIPFKEIHVDGGDSQTAMAVRSGGATSTPQVFLDGAYIGGYEEMVQSGALERFRQ